MTARRGFTLLEVLVAIAILGMGLTVILSAQAGLFASSDRAARMTIATGLARCHMNEAELKLLKDGYPFIDTREQGPCCNEESSDGFECYYKVERVELPELPELPDPTESSAGTDTAAGAVDIGDSLGSSDLKDLASSASQFGALGGLTSLQGDGVSALAGDNSLGGIASMLGAGAGDTSGFNSMISSLMALVYPNLKLMLEASIRKVTVVVSWKEGSVDRELSVVQFVASPQQGGFDPFAEEALDNLSNSLPAAGTGAPGATQ